MNSKPLTASPRYAGQRDALAGLEVGRAGLGVLPGDPADLHDRHRGGVREHDRHLEQHPQLVADVVGGHAGERLGAVAPHEHERLAARDRGDLVLEVVALAREHQRRHRPQPRDGALDGRGVVVRRLLGRAERAQRLQVGDRHPSRRTAGSSTRLAAVSGTTCPEASVHVLDVAEPGPLGPDAPVGGPGEGPQHDADHQQAAGDLVDDRVPVDPRADEEQRRRRRRGPA